MSKRLLISLSVIVALVVAFSEATLVAAISSPLERGLSSRASSQPGRPWFHEAMIPAGTMLRLRLDNAVGSHISYVGEPVQAHLDRAIRVDGELALPVGSVVLGEVTDATPAGGADGRALVGMAFDMLAIGPDRYAFDGNLIARADRADPERDAIDVIPATAGALTDAVEGSVDGQGYVLASAPNRDVRVSPGSIVWVRLTVPLRIHIRSSWPRGGA
jgi:hypothetical protein